MRTQLLIVTGFVILILSCSSGKKYITYKKDKNVLEQYPLVNDSTLLIEKISSDPQYGRIPEKPIFTGVTNYHTGGKNRERFLNALQTPDGAEIVKYRYKSCCPFRTINSHTVGADQKFGLLDIWIIQKVGDPNYSDTLYINAYDEGELIAPKGYTLKNTE